MRAGDKVLVTAALTGFVDDDGVITIDPTSEVGRPFVISPHTLKHPNIRVEVIEAAPFKPGDIVRSKGSDQYFLLGETEYRSFTPHGSRVWPYGMKTNTIAEAFPTDEYELIDGPA